MTTTRRHAPFRAGHRRRHRRPAPAGAIQSGTSRVSGHVEATEVQVAPDVGGRILELRRERRRSRDGGRCVASLDTRDIELQIRRARADAQRPTRSSACCRPGSRAEDVRQAEAQVQAAEAEVAAVEAELRAAELDLQRFESLLQANAGSRKQRDDAQARVDVARERQRGARDRVSAAREIVARSAQRAPAPKRSRRRERASPRWTRRSRCWRRRSRCARRRRRSAAS